MDGQNFQNDQNNNYYQDNTQYTQSVYNQPMVTEPEKQETPGLAVVSLVMGILSILLSCCCGIGIIFAIAGIIMAVIANKKVKTGLGTAGLICSIVGAVFSVGVLIYYFIVGAAAAMDPSLWNF